MGEEVQKAIKMKESAVKRLIRKFSDDNITEEEIEWCLYSIGDNSSFLVFNRDPVDTMISYLTKNFPESLDQDNVAPSPSGVDIKEQGCRILIASSTSTVYKPSPYGEKFRMTCSNSGVWLRKIFYTAITTTP